MKSRFWRLTRSLDQSIESIEEYRNFASLAQEYCFEWFGKPRDADWPTELFLGLYSCCARNIILRRYTIVIAAANATYEQRCAVIGHEAYHRATWNKNAMRGAEWIDEMLAFLVSQKLLRIADMGAYADHRGISLSQAAPLLSLKKLEQFHRPRPYIGQLYPCDLVSTIAGMGEELSRRIKWPDVVELERLLNWDKWFAQLNSESAAEVSSILQTLPA